MSYRFGAKSIAAASALISAMVIVPCAMGATGSSDTRASEARRLSAESETELVSKVRRTVEESLRRQLDELTEEGRRTQAEAAQQTALIVSLMHVFVEVLALVVVVAGVFGFVEGRRIEKLRAMADSTLKTAVDLNTNAQRASEAAQKAVGQIDEAAKDARESSLKISAMRHEVEKAWGDIDPLVELLPKLEQKGVAGIPNPSPPADVSMVFEDADVWLVVADRLRVSQDNTRMAKAFVSLGRYWQTIGNYPRSLARLDRAISLNSDSPEAHRELAQTLSYYAAETPMERAAKDELLRRAETEVVTTQRLLGREDAKTIEDLAWIWDERGDYSRAIELHVKAREMDQAECRDVGREPDWSITYNLACSLTMKGELERAFEELLSVIHRDQNWRLAMIDPQLKVLHDTPWGDRLRQRITELGLPTD